MDSTQRRRTSARVPLFDTDGRVLLIRFAVSRGGCEFAFWATPGGTVEQGEALDHAARRERREELGINVEVIGPVHESQSEFEYEGHQVQNTDVFFVVRLAGQRVTLSGVSAEEAGAMREIRWWSRQELDDSRETFFPPELARLVACYAGSPTV